MKKLIILFLAATTLCVSCKKNDLKQQYQLLYENADAAFNNTDSEVQQDSILTAFKQDALALLQQHLGEEYSDSVFLDLYAFLDANELDTLFKAMPKKMRANEDIARYYKNFLLQKATSKGCTYTDIQALDLQEQPVALSSLVGKTEYVLVDFWASWCGPCRRLLPILKEIYNAQPEGKLAILGVSVDRDLNSWKQALNEEQLPWIQTHETDSEPYNASDAYGVVYIPTTILIDAQGTIIARNPTEDELKVLLQ